MRIESTIRQFVSKNKPYSVHIAIVRALLAIGLLLTLSMNSVDVIFPQSIEGDYLHPGLSNTVINAPNNFFLLFGNSDIYRARYLAISVLLIVIAGYMPQITSILHFWIAHSYIQVGSFIDGGDIIHSNITLLLIPICLLSTNFNLWNSKFLTRETSPFNLVSIIAIFFIKIQAAVIYFHAAEAKLHVEEWVDGTAMYYWFNQSVFGASEGLLWFVNPILSDYILQPILTHSIILFEIVLFGALFMQFNKWKKYLFFLALFFHFLIAITMGITSFMFSMFAVLTIYFLPYQFNVLKLFKHEKI